MQRGSSEERLMRMEFDFNYCPECGSSDLEFPYIYAMSGRIRRCKACGKVWHVIHENPMDEGDQ